MSLEVPIIKLFEFLGKEQQPVTLELIREVELRSMADPFFAQMYYPCLHDVCEEQNNHYASASVGQRLHALSIVKHWHE